MAISKIKIGDIEHELQTSIPNVTNLQTALDTLQENIDSISNPDFNQNDPTASDYIKNRTHWVEENVEILPETTLVGSNGQFPISTSFTLVEGETYIVNWNGTEYTLVAKHMAMPNGISGIGLGNFSNFGGKDTGEPFILGVFDPTSAENMGMLALAMSYEGLSEVVVSVIPQGEIIHKLDNKYLDLVWLPILKTNETELLSEIEIVGNRGYSEDINASIAQNYEKLVVYCDGDRYVLNVYFDEGTGFVGNVSLFESSQPDTGEPFFMLFYSSTTQLLFKENGTHTLSVYGLSEVVNKLPPEFLPDYLPSYIYIDSDSAEILPQTTLVASDDGSFFITTPFELIEGETYTVNWNGTVYSCTAIYMDNGTISGVGVGNFGGFGGEDTGEPFIVGWLSPELQNQMGAYGLAMSYEGLTAVTLSIIGKGKVKAINYLDPKFIEEMYRTETGTRTLISKTVTQIFTETEEILPLEVGTEYEITWNGEIYTLEAYTYGDGVVLGNLSIIEAGDDTGQPFLVFSDISQPVLSIVQKTAETSTISIVGNYVDIYKIPEKYYDMPELNIIKGSAEGSLRSIYTAKEDDTYTMGGYAFATGYETKASGAYSHAEGDNTIAEGQGTHAEGIDTKARTTGAHAEGRGTYAANEASHAEGYYTTTSGLYSHAEGNHTKTFANSSHAEGYYTESRGQYSHAEGNQTITIGNSSHTEGIVTAAGGLGSHAEGHGRAWGRTITGEGGTVTYAIDLISPEFLGAIIVYGYNSAKIIAIDNTNQIITLDKTLSHTDITNVSVDIYTKGVALGDYSHTEGQHTVATGCSQHVQGEYNIVDTEYDINASGLRSKYAHIVGNGTSFTSCSNAHTLDWDGNAWFSGDVYVHSTSGTNKDEGSKKLIPSPSNPTAGDILTYNGTEWVTITKADLIAEIIAALPSAEEASF